MAQTFDKHRDPLEGALELTVDQKRELESFLAIRVEDALAQKKPQEAEWQQALRDYEAIPKKLKKDFPIEDPPNIVVPLGAIACDSLYAQSVDTMFNVSPFVTVRMVPKGTEEEKKEQVQVGKDMQSFINWGCINEWDLPHAGDDMLIDDTQLGTGVLYVPWIEKIKKTKTAKVVQFGPKIRCLPPEDLVVWGCTSGNLQEAEGVALRFWLTKQEMQDRAKYLKWDIEEIQPSPADGGWLRYQREILGNQKEIMELKGEFFETFDIYLHYDVDGDGLAEDLLIVWDRGSRRVLKCSYNPYDYRPLAISVFQKRPHLIFGIGVMKMLKNLQDAATDVMNYTTLNMLLVNCRHYKGREGAFPAGDNVKINPFKITFMDDPKTDLVADVMADVYPSSYQTISTLLSFAERRTGVNEMSNPRPSAVMGSRTPGITALTMMQQVNRRFTPAFKSMRDAFRDAIKQVLYRYKERLLAGEKRVEEHLIQVMGGEAGIRLAQFMAREDFDEHFDMELTATSAFTNKEAERQNAMMLVSILTSYYQRTMELVMVAANPQTPPAIKDVASKIAESAGELIERTIRTFDQVRDPTAFVIDFEESLDKAVDVPPNPLEGLLGIMNGGNGQGEGGVQPPQPPQVPEMPEVTAPGEQ